MLKPDKRGINTDAGLTPILTTAGALQTTPLHKADHSNLCSGSSRKAIKARSPKHPYLPACAYNRHPPHKIPTHAVAPIPTQA